MGHALSYRRARLRIGGATGILLLLAGSILVATGVAFAAVNCDSVFEGATPADPIVKTADKTQAYAGQTVTFTLTFTATGTADNVTADCYRVGDGSDDTLNALVTGFNAEQTNPNVGGKDAVQHVTYTITIPDDASLIGKKIVDRAKATSGSVESRSDLIEVLVVLKRGERISGRVQRVDGSPAAKVPVVVADGSKTVEEVFGDGSQPPVWDARG